MGNISLLKEVQYEEIQTEHGVFTSNEYLGLTAQEVYEKWLYDKENPSEPVPTIEELVKEQESKILALQEENKVLREELTQIQTSIASLTSLLAVTLEEK